jgi:hypothetical protein
MAVEAFKDYLSTTKLTFSYKAVLILALLDIVDRDGKTTTSQLIGAFHQFYLERQRQGLPAEKERERHPSPLIKPDELSDAQIWRIMLQIQLSVEETLHALHTLHTRHRFSLFHVEYAEL